MIPKTARVDDFVEVISEESDYFGMIGTIQDIDKEDTVAVINFYGKPTTLPKKYLKIKARKGSTSHSGIKERLEEQQTNNLTDEDYNDLINLALDMAKQGLVGYDWAMDLVRRKEEE